MIAIRPAFTGCTQLLVCLCDCCAEESVCHRVCVCMCVFERVMSRASVNKCTGTFFDFIAIQRLSVIRAVGSSEELMMREAVAPQRPITHQPLTVCWGLSCSMYCVCLTGYGQLRVHGMVVNAWEHIWWDFSYHFSHDNVCYHSLHSEHSNMHDSFVWMVDIWGFMDMQSRIHNHIASLYLC